MDVWELCTKKYSASKQYKQCQCRLESNLKKLIDLSTGLLTISYKLKGSLSAIDVELKCNKTKGNQNRVVKLT